MMYPFGLDLVHERAKDFQREAEAYRLAKLASGRTETWFSRMAKLFVPARQPGSGSEARKPLHSRPATAAH
jgi:hypothetical protein